MPIFAARTAPWQPRTSTFEHDGVTIELASDDDLREHWPCHNLNVGDTFVVRQSGVTISVIDQGLHLQRAPGTMGSGLRLASPASNAGGATLAAAADLLAQALVSSPRLLSFVIVAQYRAPGASISQISSWLNKPLI